MAAHHEVDVLRRADAVRGIVGERHCSLKRKLVRVLGLADPPHKTLDRITRHQTLHVHVLFIAFSDLVQLDGISGSILLCIGHDHQ